MSEDQKMGKLQSDGNLNIYLKLMRNIHYKVNTDRVIELHKKPKNERDYDRHRQIWPQHSTKKKVKHIHKMFETSILS